MRFLVALLASITLVTSFDLNVTKDMLHLAQAAYCNDVTPTQWNCKVCDNPVILEKIIANNGGKALVGYHSTYDALFVSFRGSENIENWIDNIQFELLYPYEDDLSNVGIETGFYKVFWYLFDDISDSLFELSDKYKTTDIMTTGHSLGGIASILAFEIYYYMPQFTIISLTTFGSPRIGNADFSKLFSLTNIPSTRVTHYYDIVPHLPQELLGYKHISQEIWFNKDNTDYIICHGAEDPSCSNSCGPFECTSIDQHLNYIHIQMGSSGDC